MEKGEDQRDIVRLALEKSKIGEATRQFEASSARTYAGQVIQALLLLNGAAAVAMMTFMGTLSRNAPSGPALIGLAHPLILFCFGAAAAVGTGLCAYFSQASWADGNKSRGDGLPTVAAVSAAFSLVIFLIGVSDARDTLLANELQDRQVAPLCPPQVNRLGGPAVPLHRPRVPVGNSEARYARSERARDILRHA